MPHVIIKCRVTFGRKMFNDCNKPRSICMRLVLSTQEGFSLKRAHYGYSPLPITSHVLMTAFEDIVDNGSGLVSRPLRYGRGQRSHSHRVTRY